MRKIDTTNRFLPILSLAVMVLLSACASDEPDDMGDNELDSKLRTAISNAAGGLGQDHFILPKSTDYRAIPQDPNNPLNPAKVELGKRLFHETGLATAAKVDTEMNTFSCASCHFAGAGFQAGRFQGLGEGGMGFGLNGEGRSINPDMAIDSVDMQPIRTPAALNTAYQEVMLWNGQFGARGINVGTEANWTPGTPKADNAFGYEGVEIQAIAGLKVHRLDPENELCFEMYDDLFNAAFPDFPYAQRITRETAGLAIAAYERTLLANEAPFQKWLKGDVNALDEQQKRGALVFFETANCTNCHSGPALNDMDFHALGMNDLDANAESVMLIPTDDGVRLGRGGFTGETKDHYKFKTPQLYNLASSPFYGHGGTFRSLREVIEYKNDAIAENDNVPSENLATDFVPQNLSDTEIDDLVAFLEYGLNDPDLLRYQPSSIPSGNCFPNNDPMSKVDIGCE